MFYNTALHLKPKVTIFNYYRDPFLNTMFRCSEVDGSGAKYEAAGRGGAGWAREVCRGVF